MFVARSKAVLAVEDAWSSAPFRSCVEASPESVEGSAALLVAMLSAKASSDQRLCLAVLAELGQRNAGVHDQLRLVEVAHPLRCRPAAGTLEVRVRLGNGPVAVVRGAQRGVGANASRMYSIAITRSGDSVCRALSCAADARAAASCASPS